MNIAHNPAGFLKDIRVNILEYLFGYLTYTNLEQTKSFTDYALNFWNIGDMDSYYRELEGFLYRLGYKDKIEDLEERIVKSFAEVLNEPRRTN